MAFKKGANFPITAENKTARAFKQVHSELGRLAGGVRSILGPLALIGGTTAFVSFARSTLQSADAIGKFADRAGVTTNELQKMRHAFDLAGVGVEAIDKGLLNFGKRLGKARQGIGALAGGLKGGQEELLESLKATNSTSEALNVMFKAMGNARNQAEKLAIADAAFGTAGLRMTAAFRDGSDAFFEAKREAERLGLVIEEKLIRNAEQLNDDFTRASGIIGTQLKSAFLELAPAINEGVLKIISFVTELNKVNALTNKMLSDQSLGAVFGRVQERIEEIESALEANEDSFFPSMFEGLNQRLRDELESLEIIKQAIIDTVKETGTIADTPVKPKKKKGGGIPGIDDEAAKKAAKALEKIMQAGARTTEQFFTPMEKLTHQMDKLNEQLAEGAINAGTFDRATAKAMSTFEKAIKVTGDAAGKGALAGGDVAIAKQTELLERRRELQDRLFTRGKAFRQAQADLLSLVPDAFGNVDITESMSPKAFEEFIENSIAAGVNMEHLIPLVEEYNRLRNVTTDPEAPGPLTGDEAAAMKKLNEEMARNKRVTELLIDPLDEWSRLQIILDDRLRANTITTFDHARATKALAQEYGLLKDKVNPLEVALDRLASGMESRLSGAFVDLVRGAEDLDERLRNAATSMVDEMLREFARLALIRPMLQGLFGDSGSGGGLFGAGISLVGNYFTGGGLGVATAGIGGAQGALALQGREHGGRVNRGTSYIVGEKRAEIFTPDQSGFITPRVETAQQQRQGGGNMVINIDARGSNNPAETQAAVERGIRKAAPHLINASVRAVRDNRARDPQFFG